MKRVPHQALLPDTDESITVWRLVPETADDVREIQRMVEAGELDEPGDFEDFLHGVGTYRTRRAKRRGRRSR